MQQGGEGVEHGGMLDALTRAFQAVYADRHIGFQEIALLTDMERDALRLVCTMILRDLIEIDMARKARPLPGDDL